MSKTISESLQKTATRCIKIDNWIFEIKAVRAIRVEEYGQPYSGIANININGDKAYLQQLDITKVDFDRYKNQEAISKSLDVPPLTDGSIALQLVS